MKTALLFLCGLVCLGQGLGTRTTPAHNVQRRSSSPTEDITVRLQLEVNAPDPWNLPLGDTVQITCSLSPDSDMERAKPLKLRLSREEESAIQILATEPASTGISYSLGPVTLRDRGLYRCEAFNLSHITVENVNKLIWVDDSLFSSAWVRLELLRVNRVKYFYDKTFTIGCRLYHDKSKWKIFRASEKPGTMGYEECPNQQQSGGMVSCTIPALPFPHSKSRRYDPYWCESSGRKSHVLNMTAAEVRERNSRDSVGTKFELTPAWFVREGESVVFLCDVTRDENNNKDKFDLQLIWTKMDPENNMTVLLSQRASMPINYTLANIKHEHSGVYSCWDDGTLNVFAMPQHHFVWVQDDSPPVTIDVLSHNRTMFFHNEEMTVGCQLPNDQSQWKLKRFDKWTGTIKECERSELSPSRVLSCTMNLGYPWTEYLFWCESTTGLKSNALNVTNTVGQSVLEAPSLPVMEGDDITLRCLQKNKTTGDISVAPAVFQFKDKTFEHASFYDTVVEAARGGGKRIWLRWSDDGSHTIKNVTKANEGLYSCKLENDVGTLKTFVTVKARPQEEQKTD